MNKLTFVCPNCLKKDCLDLLWGQFYCKRDDLTFSRDYLEVWNKGYREGKGNLDTYANQETYKHE